MLYAAARLYCIIQTRMQDNLSILALCRLALANMHIAHNFCTKMRLRIQKLHLNKELEVVNPVFIRTKIKQ